MRTVAGAIFLHMKCPRADGLCIHLITPSLTHSFVHKWAFHSYQVVMTAALGKPGHSNALSQSSGMGGKGIPTEEQHAIC